MTHPLDYQALFRTKVEEAALSVLAEAAHKSADDLDIDWVREDKSH